MSLSTECQAATPTRWAPIVTLAVGTFTLVAAEFLPASVLPAMAADLGVAEGVAGLAVAATALAGAVTAPIIAAVLPRTDRRSVLVGLMITATVANLCVAFAPGFAIMLVGRLVLGVAIAGYWTFAFGAGTSAVPDRDHVVSTAIALGVTAATIVGVPLASVVGDRVDWRVVFFAAAVCSALTAAALAVTLPSVPAHPTAGLAMLRGAISNPRLVGGLLAIVLVVFGNSAAYPYIRLVIEEGAPGTSAGLLLLAFGVGGVIGNLSAGRFAGRLRVVVTVAPALLAVSLLAGAVAQSVGAMVFAVVLWGVSFSMVPVATQLWVTRAEPDRAESAIALQVTAFQIAITLGSAAGGILVDGYGVTSALIVGAVFGCGASVLFALVRIQDPEVAAERLQS